MRIEIVCTGDEILTGKTVNTNYSHIAAKLIENGFDISWGTIVGDDRETLAKSFKLASERADAVIVNGGLGPTIDDLTQEVAAQAGGVGLVLHQKWLEQIDGWYRSRGREMPENNIKQAMLPAGSEFIDNPVGTACGFSMNIKSARFYFTPGVPRELYKMLDEQIISRLHASRGIEIFTKVKRFHTFGIGESRADQLLDGLIDQTSSDGIKLGFQSHYPQLETKLTVRGRKEENLVHILAPLTAEVRKRFGNFIIGEDNDSIEQQIIRHLKRIDGSIAVVEMHTAGMINSRLLSAADHPGRIKPGLISLDIEEIARFFGICEAPFSQEFAKKIALMAQEISNRTGANHGLVVLVDPNVETSGNHAADVFIGISGHDAIATRRSRLLGNDRWVRTGAIELGLDCLRRFLNKLPINELIDFEQQ